jgi:hypothetical protein
MLKSVALALLVVALSLISMLTFFIEKEENVDVDLYYYILLPASVMPPIFD